MFEVLSQGLSYFKNKNVLMLQGPVGPFFWRLSKDLKRYGANVYKVNFNLGDLLFYPFNAYFYKNDMHAWPEYFSQLCKEHQITHVILFGDCRPIHKSIHAIAQDNHVEICVFEEGYLRPNHVTFERHGVNNNSKLPRKASYYKNQPTHLIQTVAVGNTYWYMVLNGFIYHLFLWLGQFFYKKYQHHRKINFQSFFPWLLSGYRKIYFKFIESDIQDLLITKYDKRFFLAPLQVASDSQIKEHSDIDSMYTYIETIIKSFALYSANDDVLVIKQHSMDRGHVNYQSIIDYLITRYNLYERVFYIHDQHLPTLLDHAKGVVVVNSTVGLSAITNHVPTKVLGLAIYDIEGLTYQGKLDQFWMDAPNAHPDNELANKFINYITKKTQINGSFYKRIKSISYKSGLMWQLILFKIYSSEGFIYSDLVYFL